MPRLTLLLLLIFSLPSLASQVYKWTDEQGNVHFSQFPPEQDNAQSINVKNQSSSSSKAAVEKLNNTRQQLLESSVGRSSADAKDEESKEEAKLMAKNCDLSKQRLLDLEANGRIYKTLPNGEREWYDEKQRAQMIAEAKDQVAEFCK